MWDLIFESFCLHNVSINYHFHYFSREPTKESSSINALSSDLFAMSVGTNQGVSKPSFSSDLLGLGKIT